MRFLLVSNYAPFIINFRGALIAELVSKGVEVHVAAPAFADSPDVAMLLKAQGVTVHDVRLSRAGINPFIDLVSFLQLFWLMLRLRPHVFLGYTIKPVIYGLIAAFLSGVPRRFALITGLGYAFAEDGKAKIVKRIVRALYRLGLSFSDVVFFQNPDDESLFRSLGILRSSSRALVVNGSGVDVDRFSVAEVPSGRPSFLLIARLLVDKGVREFVAAARRVKTVWPDVNFFIVGWVDENPNAISISELEQWVADKTVIYLGRLTDVRPAIIGSSVFVLPSYREGTPRTVLEAMSIGRPVITTDAPGCRETVVNGENGFLVAVKSVDGLVAAMKEFVLSPELVAKMGARSRQIAEEKYDVKKVNAMMLSAMGVI